MAAGDVVNTASRLQQAAPVNGILVGEPTYRATRDAIDYREAEPVLAKGKTEPIRVWEVLGAAHAARHRARPAPRAVRRPRVGARPTPRVARPGAQRPLGRSS